MTTFNVNERLKSNKDITCLFAKGNVFINYPFKIIWLISSNNDNIEPVKLLITVSKRKFAKAVWRNRIKRQIREGYRANKNELYAFLSKKNIKINLAFIYIPTKNLSTQDITTEIKNCLAKLQIEIQKTI